MAEKKIGVAKKVAISVGALLAAIALIVGGYVAYVMLSYYRLDDSISIEADAPKDPAAELNYWIDLASDDGSSPELTVVASNLGFGAYGPDFDFFMDGGSGSVAKSAQYVEDNIKGTAEAIKELDTDFLLFQEVDVAGTRSHDVNEYELLRS